MRLRPTSEYIEAIRAVLPNSEVAAPNYRTIAQQAAGRLGLTPEEMLATRPCGGKRRLAHHSAVSVALFRMKSVGEVRAGAGRRNRSYWLPSPQRYCGAQLRPTHEQIARRAYEIYAGRGYADGNDKQDWLQAERELLGG